MSQSAISPRLAVVAALTLFAVSARAEDRVVPLGNQAQIKVSDKYGVLDGEQTRAMLKKSGEPVTNREVGFLVPTDGTDKWSVYFEFDPIGYVKDDEKDNLDANAILESIKAGTEQSNKIRAQNGGPPMTITGWHSKPRYNNETKNLEWCVAAKVQDQPLLNYNIRSLGREGVMEITLVTEPTSLDSDLPKVRELLKGFSFQSGKTYAEWRAGDKIAEYGLTALMTGGAVAVALKTGLLQKLLKPIIIGVLALGGFLAKLFGRKASE